MAKIGKKLRSIEGSRVAFMCPGCNQMHSVKVGIAGQDTHPVWMWNGDADVPTFSPSINIETVRLEPDSNREYWKAYEDFVAVNDSRLALKDPRFRHVCHSFVTNGQIIFCPDSTHKLSGQTVDLPDVT